MARPRESRLEEFVARPRRAVWVLALPMMTGMLFHTLYAVVDTAFVGRLGPEALAAITFVGPLFFVAIALSSGLATGITARSSEVAHGGMYYPTGTLKARFCPVGRRRLKEFCRRSGVSYHETGKLIVAVTAAEEPELQRLLELGQANDVEDLRLVSRAELKALEPQVRAVGALFSPRTAVLDAEGAARAYGRLAAERSGQVLTGAPVTGLARHRGGWRVEVTGGQAGENGLHTDTLSNESGNRFGPCSLCRCEGVIGITPLPRNPLC